MLGDLLNNEAVLLALGAIIAAGVGFGWKRLEAYVASTSTKLDDRILAAVKKAVAGEGETKQADNQ